MEGVVQPTTCLTPMVVKRTVRAATGLKTPGHDDTNTFSDRCLRGSKGQGDRFPTDTPFSHTGSGCDLLEQEYMAAKEGQSKRQFKGVWIPKSIWDNEDITWMEKCFIGLLSTYPYVTTSDAARLMGISIESVHNVKSRLRRHGYFEPSSLNPHLIRSLIHDGNERLLKCPWCGRKSFILESHHFPIKESDGGGQSVEICGGCHSDYHFLETV